jgi:hypothetical protein
MWYLVEILFAEPKRANRRMYMCESCNVIFQSDSAEEAYDKALHWGQNYIVDESEKLQLLGVSDLTSIGEEIGEGVEICGRYFQKLDVWDRIENLIPSHEKLSGIQWETSDKPIGELLDPHQIYLLKKRL